LTVEFIAIVEFDPEEFGQSVANLGSSHDLETMLLRLLMVVGRDICNARGLSGYLEGKLNRQGLPVKEI
jgi:hypothetical protein